MLLLDSPRTVKSPASIDVTVSDSLIKFKCNVIGEQSPVISWYKDRKLLPQYRRQVIHSDGILHVQQPTLDDEGVYTCLVNNNSGEQVAEASVRYDGLDGREQIHDYVNKRYFALIDMLMKNYSVINNWLQNKRNKRALK